MTERPRSGEAEVLIDMPPSDELIARLSERDLLIPGDPNSVCSTFVAKIGGRRVTPREIATSWAQAREVVMGERHSFAKFMIGLHGTDVIKALIPEKDLARQATNHLSSAFSEVARRA